MCNIAIAVYLTKLLSLRFTFLLFDERTRLGFFAPRRHQARILALPNDVIMAVDGITLGSDGKIPFRKGERVDLLCYISSMFEGDILQVTVWRDGDEMDVKVPLTRIPSLVPSHYNNKPPPFLICSGFVFTALSVPYLEAKDAWGDYYSDSVSHLLGLVHEPLKQRGDEVVVLSQVLAHKSNLGYEHLMDLHLIEFNGVEVRCLRHLQQMIDESTEPFMSFQFSPKETGRLVVMDRKINDKVTEDVCSEHCIGMPFLFHDES
jgi:hypothetical protein